MPLYNLEQVKKAAQEGSIEYRGRKVQRDIDNLNYSRSDVTQCILQLSDNNFSKTITHKNDPHPDDVYHFNYIRLDEDGDELPPDRLYIKFRLIDDYLEIDLGSFHLS